MEYVNKEVANNARELLSREKLPQYSDAHSFGLSVEFILPEIVSFEALHSKCLFITNLPENYKDMCEFRKKLVKDEVRFNNMAVLVQRRGLLGEWCGLRKEVTQECYERFTRDADGERVRINFSRKKKRVSLNPQKYNC